MIVLDKEQLQKWLTVIGLVLLIIATIALFVCGIRYDIGIVTLLYSVGSDPMPE